MSEANAATVVWVNVPSEHLEEFRQWHNCEHSTDRLEGPGYVCLHRYMWAGGDRRHNCLNFFEGEGIEAFDSPYYLQSRNNPTPWTRKCMAFLKDAERGVYRLETTVGAPPRYDAPYLYTVRVNPAWGPGAEEELAAWYREEHLERMCAVEGVLRGRIFRRDERLSSEKTEENRIQDMTAGRLPVLAAYEMSTLAPINTDAWFEAAFGTPRSAAMREKVADGVRERWWLDFAKWKRA